MQDWDLYDERGNRKYLTSEERATFFRSIAPALPHASGRIKRTFAMMLYYTGCRISEGLTVTAKSVDFSQRGVILKSAKKRKGKIKYRFIPLPDTFLEKLDDVHRIKDTVKRKPNEKLWGFCRTTGWGAIKKVMAHAEIEGIHAVPHGLRHAAIIALLQLKYPPHKIKEFAGWETTEMLEHYGRVIGAEERKMIEGFWNEP